MGAMMRAHDWSASPLGHPAHWPAPLRTSIGIILNCAPSDVCRLGSRSRLLLQRQLHPDHGRQAPAEPGRPLTELWAEVWERHQGPDRPRHGGRGGLAGGISPSSSPATAIRKTHGSPFPGRRSMTTTGHVAGLLCSCTETTREVKDRSRLAHQVDLADRLRRLFETRPASWRFCASPATSTKSPMPPTGSLSATAKSSANRSARRCPSLKRRASSTCSTASMPPANPSSAAPSASCSAVAQTPRKRNASSISSFSRSATPTAAQRHLHRRQRRHRSGPGTRALRLLVELGDRLRDLNDTGEIAQTAAELLGRTMGISRAGYGRVDPSGQYVTVERDWTNGEASSIAGVHRFRNYGTSSTPFVGARSLSSRTSPPTPVPPAASRRSREWASRR